MYERVGQPCASFEITGLPLRLKGYVPGALLTRSAATAWSCRATCSAATSRLWLLAGLAGAGEVCAELRTTAEVLIHRALVEVAAATRSACVDCRRSDMLYVV